MLDAYIEDEDMGTALIDDENDVENYDAYNYPYIYNSYIQNVPEEENLQGLQINNPKIAFWTAVAAIGLSAVALVVGSSKHKSDDLTTKLNPVNPVNFGDYEDDTDEDDYEDEDEDEDEEEESDEPDQEGEDWVE